MQEGIDEIVRDIERENLSALVKSGLTVIELAELAEEGRRMRVKWAELN